MNLGSIAPSELTLPCGLRAQAIELPDVHSVVITAQIKVGSRFETKADNGISHFLEHMVYRGTERYPSAHALSVAFESLGGTLMASTSVDTGAMTIRVPVKNQGAVLKIFAEVFANPILDGIEIERGIVSEEILEGLDDDGGSIDPDNLIRAQVFRDHPLGMPITGTLTDLGSFSADSLRAHLERFYTADNTVVTIAGPGASDVALAQIAEAFAGTRRGVAPPVEAPPQASGSCFDYVMHSSSQTNLRVAFQAPSWTSASEPAMEVVMRLLDDGMSTRLYHRICDERGLCYDVSGGYETYVDGGLVELAAESVHERSHLVLEQLLSIIAELRDVGPSAQEMDLVKQRHQWQFEQMLDSSEAVAEYFAVEALTGEARSPTERQRQIEAVSAEDVRRVAKQYFRADNLHVTAVGAMKRQEQKVLEQLTARFS